jgi:hypothetical protein
LSIEQLRQIVNSLIQQIQQLIKLIAVLKPQETCGNGICRFCETATTCPADCSALTCYKEGEGPTGITTGSGIACCAGLTAKPRTTCTGSRCLNIEGFICQK